VVSFLSDLYSYLSTNAKLDTSMALNPQRTVLFLGYWLCR